MSTAPVGERTITGLSVLLQSNDLKQALRSYCVGGPYGRLLDAEAEHLGAADVQAFEIEGLVGTGAAPAVLAVPLALSPIVTTPAYAIIVFDPSNYAQNVLQAARALQQINQQITSLQNEAQMLINVHG